MPNILSAFTDPAEHSPEERTRAVAAILAAGLLRLRQSLTLPEPSHAAGGWVAWPLG